nr:OTU domain-containing protein 5-A-like isoform X2 [Labrus bergylta]
MTILPKKKPSSGVGVSDHTDDSDRRSSSDPHPHPHPHPHPGRTGARPRASPPPWSYQPAPPSARDDRRSIEASSRPQQASPPPVGSVSPVGPVDSRDSSGGMVSGSRGELVVSAGVVGCGGAIGSCCSGPGLSKRRRQAGTCSGGVVAALAGGGQPGVTGPGGVGSSQETEEGAGNNSEDEYENAARLQSVDPATVEQEHWFEKALTEKKGFVIKKMKEDGACLFRAVGELYTHTRLVLSSGVSMQFLRSPAGIAVHLLLCAAVSLSVLSKSYFSKRFICHGMFLQQCITENV